MLGSKISFFLLLFFYIPAIIEMPFIFKLWLKNVPEYAILFCRLGLIRNLVEQLFVTLSGAIAAVGNVRKFQIFSSILNFFPLVISYILFSFGFPVYVIYIVFIIYALVNGLMTLYFTKVFCELSISTYLKNIVAPCLVSFVLIFILSCSPLSFDIIPIYRLFFVISISTISFLITFWFIGISKEERLKISSITAKFIKKTTI
jgi:hypothetical protein